MYRSWVFIFFHFFFFGSGSIASFLPLDNFLIDCGGNQTLKIDYNGRTFNPDLGSSSVVLSPISNIVACNVDVGSSNLYSSARVFTESSTYTFSVRQKGYHWVRLHFHPVEDSIYDLKSAVFSVVAGNIELLHEFSFTKSVRNVSNLMKEYVVYVGSNRLVLTISPSNASIAFINGIEVISTPGKQFPVVAASVPVAPPVRFSKRLAFETMYRINMGGPFLSQENDTLWRIWQSDQPFLFNPAAARNVSVSPSSIRYPSGVSDNIAPNLVYATAQEMADANVVNQKFNVSWMFDVDPDFSYLLRLHFCDIVSEVLHDLVFDVYIDNQYALNTFDISSKTMQLSTAYFVDFVVSVSTGTEKILVQIGPPNLINFSPKAILNGLEILKLSNSDNSFDRSYGVNFVYPKPPKKNKMMVVTIASLVGVAGILGFVVAAYYLYFRRRSKLKEAKHTSAWLPLPAHVANFESKISTGSRKSGTGSYTSSVPSSSLGRILSFLEIQEATSNFDESLILGVGGFGKVYRGTLENGIVVAVKRGNPRSQQGLVEFKTEIDMLSKLRHRHLVSLIGYCEELSEMILVYEFMAGGPLRKHLYGSDLPPLSWKQRLEICIGAAKGLHYLHTGASEIIIHRDVKTTNILLDENLVAKVADFGLSKAGPTLDQTHVSTAVKGSFGYLDPEYFRRQQLTEKSDVYSFGVVLMEVLCARPAINPALPREQVNIAEWAMHWQKQGQLEQIIDPHLVGTVNLDSLRKYGETAEKCLAEQGISRPTMGEVLWNLEYAVELQEIYTKNAIDENSCNIIPDLPACIPQIRSFDGDDSSMVSNRESEIITTSEVFSQLISPKGR